MNGYEAAVVGGGPAGYACAIRLAQNGIRTVLIEANPEEGMGGTCLNRGCIPSKVLLMSSGLYKQMCTSSNFGISCENAYYDPEAVYIRKKSVVDALRKGMCRLCRSYGVDVIYAQAALKGKNCLCLPDGRLIYADHIVLAVGSRPDIPPVPGFDLPGVITADDFVNDKLCPERTVIIGGGPVGMEMAQHLTNLGRQVLLLEAGDSVLNTMDADIARAAAESLVYNGAVIRTGVQVQSISGGLKVRYLDGKGVSCDAKADLVILACGRRADTGRLGLEKADIQLTKNGFVQTDALCRTNVPGIFAVGDVNGRYMMAHGAEAEGVLAAEQIAGHIVTAPGLIPSCVYLNETAAMVGMTEQEVRKAKLPYKVSVFSAGGSGRAMIMGKTDGMVKLIIDPDTGRILGGHVFAPDGENLIMEAALAMSSEGDCKDLAAAVHPHPSLCEMVSEAAGIALGNSVHVPKMTNNKCHKKPK